MAKELLCLILETGRRLFVTVEAGKNYYELLRIMNYVVRIIVPNFRNW